MKTLMRRKAFTTGRFCHQVVTDITAYFLEDLVSYRIRRDAQEYSGNWSRLEVAVAPELDDAALLANRQSFDSCAELANFPEN